MKEMGVSNPADIKITLLTTDTDGAKKQAEVLQEQYQKNLGITVEINQVTYKQRLQMETEKDYDMVVTGWVPDYSDAYSYLELWISDGQYNHSGYRTLNTTSFLKILRQRQMLRQDRICCSRQKRSSLKKIPLLYRFSYVETSI